MCLNETYSKVGINKNMSDAFPVQSGTHQLLVYADLLI